MRLLPAAVLPALSLVALALAACSRQSEGPPPPAPPPEPSHILGGVDLDKPIRAVGNEPFWYVTLDGTHMVYGGPDRPERSVTQSPVVMRGTTATFTGQAAQGGALEVTLVATECSDGMSDRTYPLVARVKVGGETLIGCAAATSTFTPQPE